MLLAKNPDKPIPPASMSKLMTVNMVFEALASGRLSLDEEFVVSEKAWRMGGSKMFVNLNERISVSNLLRGVIIQSGNDACIVLAEGLAGSEAEFARRMTRRAKELGLDNSSFANATGWPDEDHRMSVRDLAMLAERIITEFPEYYSIYSETSFEWAEITQRNRNPLLLLDIGADGLKTGHTEEAGYGLVGSAVQDERRLILVIGGLNSTAERAQEAERILKWGFREFETVTALEAGAQVGEAAVWVGEKPTVPLTVEAPIVMTAPYGRADEIKAEIRYDGPVTAPIEKGRKLGVLRLTAPDVDPVETPVYAGEAVAKGGFTVKLKAAAGLLVKKALESAAPDAAPAQ